MTLDPFHLGSDQLMTHHWNSTRLASLEEAFKVFADLRGRLWLCRGQAKCYGALLPSIDRGHQTMIARTVRFGVLMNPSTRGMEPSNGLSSLKRRWTARETRETSTLDFQLPSAWTSLPTGSSVISILEVSTAKMLKREPTVLPLGSTVTMLMRSRIS